MDRMGNMRRTHYSVAVKPEMAGQEALYSLTLTMNVREMFLKKQKH